MPLYEYQCTKCHRRTEKIEKVDGPHLKKCPHCGGKVEAMISAPAIQFKGSGWYVTDYAGKKSGAPDSSSKESADSKDAASDAAKVKDKDGATKESSSKEGSKEAASKEGASKETASVKDSKEKKASKKKD